MKKILFIAIILPIISINAQRIGELAPEKPHLKLPNNSWGINLLFGEGGFGLGTFLRHSFGKRVTGFVDFSFSESKDERETERFDIFGRPLPTPGKVNRVFVLPLTFGLQYRLFYDTITDNLRPYIDFGVGPTLAVTTPAQLEIFSSFKKAHAKLAAGGYVGFGANFGVSTSSLMGLTFRYYLIHFFDKGVESLANNFRQNLGSFYFGITLGIMY